MSEPIIEVINYDSAAELFRLTLSKLGKYRLAITPVNYSLIYYYLSGNDLALNRKLDQLLNNIENWTEQEANRLFTQYVCQGGDNEDKNKLREELLNTVANILGMLIDLAGKTAISNQSLENHMKNLASTKEPGEILHIASDIISETRIFVDESKRFENSLMVSSHEIEALKHELDDVRKQAIKDALTGLNNRRAFDQALLASIESQNKNSNPFCLLMLDIDFFKAINDNYGHLVGDKVLSGLGQVLIKNMRGGDYLCRYGGEEFAVIMNETLITGAFTVAENLRKTIEKLRLKHTKTDQSIGKITISIGVACYRHGESGVSIIDRCDKALYRAKSLGRNRTVIAD